MLSDIQFNDIEVLKLHLDLYYGYQRDVDQAHWFSFSVTLKYCLIHGIFNSKNLDFTEFCENNFSFSDERFESVKTLSYLKYGSDLSKIPLNYSDWCLYPLLWDFPISRIDFLKSFKIVEIVTYLEILNNLPLSEGYILNNYSYTLSLRKGYNLEQKLFNLPKFSIQKSLFEYGSYILFPEIFQQNLNVSHISSIYYSDPVKNDLEIFSRVHNIEGSLLLPRVFELNWYENEDSVGHHLRTIKVNWNNKNVDLSYEFSRCVLVGSFMMVEAVKIHKPKLLFLNEAYPVEFIKEYREIDEEYFWLMVYSNVKLFSSEDLSFLKNESYIEEDVYKYLNLNLNLPIRKNFTFE